MRVMFIVDYSFPAASALSNRIETLAKSIAAEKNYVDILCLNGTFRKNDNIIQNSHEYNVIYSYSKIRPNGFFLRNIYKLIGYFRSFFIIYSENNKNKINAVFLPRRNPFGIFIILLFCRILDIKIFQEISEYPEIFITNLISKINYIFTRRIFYKHLDGIVLMTNFLYQYFRDLNISEDKLVIVPMSVDVKRFEKEIVRIIPEDFIAYCGSINTKKDGLDILFRSFSIVRNSVDGLKLYIIGNGTKNAIQHLNSISNELKIQDKIKFLGLLPRDEIPDILKQAKALVLARPRSLQAEGGFPTKLGEYLATKNPVVITDVGEISNYLKDGESAFIADPDSVESFSEKLIECLTDQEKAFKIGEKGYQVALESFDLKSHSDKLCGFIERFTNSVIG